jgi:hypothetical protein
VRIDEAGQEEGILWQGDDLGSGRGSIVGSRLQQLDGEGVIGGCIVDDDATLIDRWSRFEPSIDRSALVAHRASD